MDSGKLSASPLTDTLAAVSVGIVDGTHVLDLAYEEDSKAQVDMNVVMTGSGELVEIQGTAEDSPFPRRGLDTLLDLAEKGVKELTALQQNHLPEKAHLPAQAAG
jgi:ribonuclease PH